MMRSREEDMKKMRKEIYDEIFEEGFRAYCEANRLLERDLSHGLMNERIPAKEEQEARESYYDYMKRRNREEDEKMRIANQSEKYILGRCAVPSVKDVLSSDTLDGIAKDALIWHRSELIADMIAFEDGDKSRWVHPDDYAYKSHLLVAMNKVLEYFGVESMGTLVRRAERGLPCPQCGMYDKHKMDCTNI